MNKQPSDQASRQALCSVVSVVRCRCLLACLALAALAGGFDFEFLLPFWWFWREMVKFKNSTLYDVVAMKLMAIDALHVS
jgi:hypothetical protein